MEYLPGPAPLGYEKEVADIINLSDAFISIIDSDFGTAVGFNVNYIMKEYEIARRAGIPRFIFVSQALVEIPRQELNHSTAVLRQFVDKIESVPDREGIYYYQSDEDILTHISPALDRACIRDFATYIHAPASHDALSDNRYLKLLKDSIFMLMGAMERFVQLKLNSADSDDIGRLVMSFTKDVEQLLEQITKDFHRYPLVIELAEETILRLARSIEGMTSDEGYRPASVADLKNVAERLYKIDRLKSLDTTSIVSNRK
jgi:hypothetical protein